jgi:hypothetical protein
MFLKYNWNYFKSEMLQLLEIPAGVPNPSDLEEVYITASSS